MRAIGDYLQKEGAVSVAFIRPRLAYVVAFVAPTVTCKEVDYRASSGRFHPVSG